MQVNMCLNLGLTSHRWESDSIWVRPNGFGLFMEFVDDNIVI